MPAKRFYLFLILIVLAGAFLRLWHLGTLPEFINRDEAALGYNAFAISQTGKDEHGVTLPLNFTSFGDQKLGGYIYAAVPFVSLFGLSVTTTRLPSALAGIAIIIITAFLTQSILINYTNKNTKLNPNFISSFGLLVAAVLAFSPYAIYLSRMAYESHLALAFFLLGWLGLERAKQRMSSPATHLTFFSPSYLLSLIALIFLFLPLFTYHSYQIILPLFFVVFALFNFNFLRRLLTTNRLLFTSYLLVPLGALIVLIAGGTFSASLTKSSGLLITDTSFYAEDLFAARQALTSAHVPAPLASLLVNRYTLTAKNLLHGYAQALDPSFLFGLSDDFRERKISTLGHFYLLDLIFFTLGCAIFIIQRRRWQLLLISLLVVALLPAAISISPQHVLRGAAALPLYAIIIALGIHTLYHYRPWSKLLTLAIVAINLIYLCFSYYIIAPHLDFARSDYQINYLTQDDNLQQNFLQPRYDSIKVDFLHSSPYIFLLFYTQFPPDQLSQNLHFLPPDDEGFTHADRLGDITFGPIDFNALESSAASALLFVPRSHFPADRLNSTNPLSARYHLLYPHLSLNDNQDDILIIGFRPL